MSMLSVNDATHSLMPSTDLFAAVQVDLALLLLSKVEWLSTSCTLAARGVPVEVATRVLPLARDTSLRALSGLT